MKNGLTRNFVWYEKISYYSSGLTLQSKLPCLCSVCRGVPHNIGEACFFVQSIVWHLVFMDQIRTTGSEFLGILQMFYHSSNSLYPYTYMEHIQVLSITDHFRFDWNVMIRRTLQTNILNDFFCCVSSGWTNLICLFIETMSHATTSTSTYNLSIGFFYSTYKNKMGFFSFIYKNNKFPFVLN